MRADLAAERARLEDRIASLDALLSFTLRDLAYNREGDRAGLVYVAARRMLAERRRNAAADALDCVYCDEAREEEERRDAAYWRRVDNEIDRAREDAECDRRGIGRD